MLGRVGVYDLHDAEALHGNGVGQLAQLGVELGIGVRNAVPASFCPEAVHGQAVVHERERHAPEPVFLLSQYSTAGDGGDTGARPDMSNGAVAGGECDNRGRCVRAVEIGQHDQAVRGPGPEADFAFLITHAHARDALQARQAIKPEQQAVQWVAVPDALDTLREVGIGVDVALDGAAIKLAQHVDDDSRDV